MRRTLVVVCFVPLSVSLNIVSKVENICLILKSTNNTNFRLKVRSCLVSLTFLRRSSAGERWEGKSSAQGESVRSGCGEKRIESSRADALHRGLYGGG